MVAGSEGQISAAPAEEKGPAAAGAELGSDPDGFVPVNDDPRTPQVVVKASRRDRAT
jgi:hypothetical protein